MNIYIWSDLHLYHANIIEYEDRPFSSLEEMNAALLENWQKTVKSNDIIFNLGDFMFNTKKDIVNNILQQMPGHKILVLGNHDKHKSVKWWLDAGFNEVYKYPIIYEGFYILSHEPLYVNKSMPYINIHGHIHGQKYEGNQYVNVSIEHIDYKPVNFEEIKKKFVNFE